MIYQKYSLICCKEKTFTAPKKCQKLIFIDKEIPCDQQLLIELAINSGDFW
jgi:hypothetical protein